MTRIPGALDRKGASSDDQCEYENLSHIFELPRVLYHGTSIARLRRILSEGRLAVSATGPDRKVSLTTEVSVAEYFACHAVLGDRRSGVVSKPIVLLIDGEGLLELNYELTAFSDPIWGDGRCDWENEIACWTDIKPLDEVLIAVEPVSVARYNDCVERGHMPFMPPGPPRAAQMLGTM